MMDNEVQGISFISLVTNSEEVFGETAKFYHRLGFRLVRNYSKMSNSGASSALYTPKLHLGVANDSLKEIWLESFPLQNYDDKGFLKPWQEHDVYNGDKCKKLTESTVIKLRLTSVEKPILTGKQIRFFTTALDKVKSILLELGSELGTELVEQQQETGLLVTHDPMGNEISFSNHETPLSHKGFDSADEYLHDKSRELLQSLGKLRRASCETELPQEKSKKKKIAVMTSGGDAPGMNPAVRAVVRSGIYLGCDVFAVYEGYSGLVKGGDLLKQMKWEDVRPFLSMGGTAIGTARCAEFRQREGRLAAAYNMIVNGIDALIVCGGDGSLTGADLFRSEWPSLLQELVSTGQLTEQNVKPFQHLTIVGLVGSIDNDMSSTDATIGAYSSLARITEMVDYIDATAQSHSRAFVIEVMGRHCGWLGLMSGISTGADFIFIPERPPKAGQWKQELKAVCSRHREKGKRKTTIIVSEGAIDDELNPITSEQVKNVLVDLGLDTRITTLGHVQRGGTAVAWDRLLATLQGVDAVKAVLELKPDDPSPMIGIAENKIVRHPLVDAVRLTKEVAKSIENKDFDRAMSLRDSTFEEAYKNYLLTSIYDDGSQSLPQDQRLNIGIVHVGASSAGLNATTRAAALYCLSKGHKLFAIKDGFSGLIHYGEVKELSWLDVESWHNKGGSEIGTNRRLPSEDFGKVAYYLQKYNLNGLIIVGGFESFTALHELESNRSNYPIFNMPMVVIPATVSNNVPGTELSLGGDTCLNQLVNYCDAVKQSASSSRRRVFVVEVQGGHSGYVASCCGLITGAIATYTPESQITLGTIQEDIDLLFDVFENDRGEYNNGKMIIRNEQASSVYTTELIADIIKESAGGRFETRTAIPGHVQQGFTPSSMDRVFASRFAVKSCQFIEEWNAKHKSIANGGHGSFFHNKMATPSSAGPGELSDQIEISSGSPTSPTSARGPTSTSRSNRTHHDSSAVIIGIRGAGVEFSCIQHLYNNEANIALRKGKTIHWSFITNVGDMLSGRLLLRKEQA